MKTHQSLEYLDFGWRNLIGELTTKPDTAMSQA